MKVRIIVALLAIFSIDFASPALACNVKMGYGNSCHTQYMREWNRGTYGNGGAWDPRGWNGRRRSMPVWATGGHYNSHVAMGYYGRPLVVPPHAVRRLPPRRPYPVAYPVAAGFTVGSVIGARGGYAAVGGAPYIPTPVGVSVVPINPPRSAAVTVPSAQPSPEAILEAQRAAGNVLRIPNKCAAGWTLTERGTCATVEFDTVAAATPACEQGWILTERGTCAMTVRE